MMFFGLMSGIAMKVALLPPEWGRRLRQVEWRRVAASDGSRVNVLHVKSLIAAAAHYVIAARLLEACKERGLRAMMAVDTRLSRDEAVRHDSAGDAQAARYRLWTAAARAWLSWGR